VRLKSCSRASSLAVERASLRKLVELARELFSADHLLLLLLLLGLLLRLRLRVWLVRRLLITGSCKRPVRIGELDHVRLLNIQDLRLRCHRLPVTPKVLFRDSSCALVHEFIVPVLAELILHSEDLLCRLEESPLLQLLEALVSSTVCSHCGI